MTLDEAYQAIGATREEAEIICHNLTDQIPFPYPVMIEVRDSPIHGKGLFALKNFYINDVIAPARIGLKRTPGGRYANHGEANACMKMHINNDVELLAIKIIKVNEEILTNYYQNYINTRVKS